MTYREAEWEVFAELVKDHIREYTVKQYGDMGSDEIEDWTEEQCVKAISKYIKRSGNNARGELEELRDCVKIAHFACFLFMKKNKALAEKESKYYEEKIRKGK